MIEVTVKGRKVSVNVSDDGRFVAEVDGETIQSKTLEGFKSNLAQKIQPLNIPFIMVNDRWHSDKLSFRKGVILSVHSSTGKLIARTEGQRSAE